MVPLVVPGLVGGQMAGSHEVVQYLAVALESAVVLWLVVVQLSSHKGFLVKMRLNPIDLLQQTDR